MPSPSSLPVPSHLFSHRPDRGPEIDVGAQAKPNGDLLGYDAIRANSTDDFNGTAQSYELARSAADVGGDAGDVVLDQLVTGLLATPCIRRRLDQLYGKVTSWQ